jgi:hypothetical protein
MERSIEDVVADQQTRPLSKRDLKAIAEKIVLAQGNKFIKELLRDHGIPIGATKSDFSANLKKAIDDDLLTRQMIDDWLARVEGWGDQHIYLYRPPTGPVSDLRTAISRSRHKALLDRPISYDFPDKLALSAVALSEDHLSVSWHRSNEGWVRTKRKDFRDEQEGDFYEFRAFRQRMDRSVLRFEWRFRDPFCAVMLQLPHEGEVHRDALALVWKDLEELGLIDAPLAKIPLSEPIKALSRGNDAVVQSTKMITDGGHVELVATGSDTGIAAVEAVRQVRRAVDDSRFQSADGIFSFIQQKYPELSRPVKIQGYGSESRIRIWMQCERQDVYLIIAAIWQGRSPT